MGTIHLREIFETEILKNITKRCGNIANATKTAIEEECLYYSTAKCLESDNLFGGYLPDSSRDQLLDDVCSVFDKHFASKYDKGFCQFQYLCLMSNIHNARLGVENYYNRFR